MTDEENRITREIQNVHGKRKNHMAYGLREMYRKIPSKDRICSEKQFGDIVRCFNSHIVDWIFDKCIYRIPGSLGQFRLYSINANVTYDPNTGKVRNNNSVDMKPTLILWATDPDARKEKFKVMFTGNYKYYRVFFVKDNARYKFKNPLMCFRYVISRKIRNRVADAIEKGEVNSIYNIS